MTSPNVLAGSYDYRLVALSAILAVLASYTALDLGGRVAAARGVARLWWLIVGAVAMGIGIWSMHYVAMLAFSLPVSTRYDWPLVVLSLLAGILASAVALFVVSGREMGSLRAIAGSIFMGTGIAALHYIGMEAMRLPAMCHYSPALVTFSVVVAILGSLLALRLTFLLRDDAPRRRFRRAASALLMGAAISSMHYSGMAAVTFTASAEVPDLSHAVSISFLGVAGIGIVSIMVLAVTLLTALMDRLRKQGTLFDALFEQAPQAVVLMTADDQIIRVNREFTRLFGYTVEETVGRRLGDLIVPDESRDELRRFADLVAKGQRVEAEVVRRRKDGSRLCVSLIRVAVWVPDGQVAVYAILRDITERKRSEAQRKQAEAERERYAGQLHKLACAAVVINSLASVEDVLRVTTEEARAIVGAHQSMIVLTKDESWAAAVHVSSLSDKYAAYRSFDAPLDGSGIYALVRELNRPLRMTQAELEAHPRWRGFGPYAAQHPPMRGWLAAPLLSHDGRNLGLIQLSDKSDGDFTAADEAIVVQLAQMASVAIENARLFAQVQSTSERLHSLSHQLVEAQEDERRRIARELHDEIGQALTALKFNLQSMQQAGVAIPTLDESIALAERTLQQVRDLSLDLRPSLLDDLGLYAALRWYVDRQAQRAEWTVQFTGDDEAQRLPAEIETVCFRVAQEAVTNAVRYARATHVSLDVRRRGAELLLTVRDDGIGFDMYAAHQRALGGHSMGLLGMQERVALVGGRLEIRSTPGMGTEIRVCLPIVSAPMSVSTATGGA